MKIEVWYDFACPLCYIGKRRLDIALDQFEYEDKIEVIFKSFEIDAFAEKESDKTRNEITAEKYHITLEEAKTSNNYLVEKAKTVGLDFKLDELVQKNTFDAHRLLQYAKTENKTEEMLERIFKAHFVDALNISDHTVLSSLADEIGLNRENVIHMLESERFSEEVSSDEETASKLGIDGVPYCIINHKFRVPGALPPELLVEILDRAREDERAVESQSIIDDLLERIG